jgi:hypothetical protein
MDGRNSIWSRKRKWVDLNGKGAKKVPKASRARKKVVLTHDLTLNNNQ